MKVYHHSTHSHDMSPGVGTSYGDRVTEISLLVFAGKLK